MINSSPNRLSRRYRLLVCALPLILIAIITLTARAWLVHSAKSELPRSTTMAQPQPLRAAQPLASSAQPIQVERVTVTATGFDPDQITRPAGQVIIAVDNRSGLDEVWLRLDREGGERLVDTHVEKEKLDWRGRMTLAPGRYRITEAEHPDWICLITVTE